MTRVRSLRNADRRRAGVFYLLAALLAYLGGCAGCGGDSATVPAQPVRHEACLEVNASSNLNLYDGQAHSVTLYLFPLVSQLGFEQSSVRDLLDGETPPGVAGPAVLLTIGPGEKRNFREVFPDNVVHVGIVVDYYGGSGSEGPARAVVPVNCGESSSPRVTLAPQGIVIDRR